ncbi:translocation/assembly module TamB domain-containing protein [Rubritalea profundi]|uniref:Translocation and assembly module TamB C-terminal domain-containing protein n=1 Tax=Rubritalea profundi TaxID=1658618 RepID=A0A2S7U094_9BACT|nr:translocation/assembly module TamB domain-containing protein [Rubritalea profundi]PQJ27927.1 hypothetical protein BSZ32_05035 [Rubritalea profundi]
MLDDPCPITKPKRKWRKRLLWLTGFLCVLVWALNGPLARWGVHYAIDQALLSQEMEGDCKVNGTLRTGFTLSQFDYIGTGGLQKIQFSQASADYRLFRELIHGQVRGVTLHDATMVIDLSKFVSSESDEETSIQKIKKTLFLVREWVRQPAIQLSDIDVSLLRDDELFAEFQLQSLHHTKQSDSYHLVGFQTKDSEHIETPLQDVDLIWTDSKIDLGRLEILPDVALLEAHADWSAKLKGSAQLQILTAEISVEMSEEISAKLHSGSLDAATLAQRFQLELPFDFSLNALDARVDNWLDPIPTWKISCGLDLANIEYDEYQLEYTKLHFSQNEGDYDLKLDTVFKKAPLHAELVGRWTNLAAESWWSYTDLKYQINCAKLANISSLIPTLPEKLELGETSVALEGVIKIADLKLVDLDTQLKIDGAKIDQTPIPSIQIDAVYSHLKKGAVKVTAKDEDAIPIQIDASYTFENDKYEAEISVVEKHPLWINKILAAYDTGLEIENSLNLHWKGNGHSDLAAPQTGKLAVAPLSISYKDENYQLEDTHLHFTQNDGSYELKLDSLYKKAPLQAEFVGKWTNLAAENWWSYTDLKYQISCAELGNIPSLIHALPDALELGKTSVALEGKIKVDDFELVSLDTQLKIDGVNIDQTPVPSIQIDAVYSQLQKGTVKVTATDGESIPIEIEASYTFDDDKYQAEIAVVEKHPLWINKFLAAYDTGLKVENSLSLHWQGTGHSDLEAPQVGKLTLEPLKLSYKEEAFELTTGLEYQWPESVTLKPLQIRHDDFTANAELHWDGQFIHLNKGSVSKGEESISTIIAKIPFTREINSLESFLAQENPWLVDADSKLLPIQKISQWLKLDNIKQMHGLEGSVSLSLDLIGSPHKPDIKGNLKLEGLRGIANKDLAPLHMLADFETQDQRLSFTGVLTEAKTQRMKLDLAIPLTPLQWVQKSENLDAILKESKVDGKLKINTLPLNRIARFLPQLKEVTGHLDGNATITGTLLDPQIELDTRIEIPLLVIADDTVDDISDILIEFKANSDRKITANLKASVNGGLFQADAKVDLADLKNPLFEVNAKTDYAMVFRNDSISVRANAKLKLAGTLEDATLSGDIGFVESLFYKDIDILPIGVPSSAVSKVELPAIDSKNFTIPIPKPFDAWKLGLKVSMQDPLLIRGNIAGGQIEGGVKVTGTFAEPALDGTIYAKYVVAKLPFSTLKIHKGEIKFHPKNGLIPTLDIQGKSVVSNYDTSIFVYGLATSPKTTFTSFPPLAKNDIMTLLATGVTAQDLSNNKEAATLRALQLFLAKIKQESGQSHSTKILEVILSSIDDFEFNINETNGFTGRKFSSAKIKLNDRIYITAQVDEKKQTRGLVVFVLKFR